MWKDISTSMVAMIALYIFSLVYGLNFLAAGIALGADAVGLIFFALIVLLPALFLSLYFLRGRIEFLYGRERLLRWLSYVFALISVVFTVIFIIPISY